MTDLTDLLNAVNRATASGLTDEGQLRLDAAKKINEAIIEAIKPLHVDQGGPLSTGDCLAVLAANLGTLILVARKGGPETGLLIMMEVVDIMAKAALAKE